MKELGVLAPIMFSMSYVTLMAIIFQQSLVVKNHSGKEARLPTDRRRKKAGNLRTKFSLNSSLRMFYWAL